MYSATTTNIKIKKKILLFVVATLLSAHVSQPIAKLKILVHLIG